MRNRGVRRGVGLMASAVLAVASIALAQEGGDVALGRTAHVEDPRPLGVGRVLPDIELTPLRGGKQRLTDLLKDRKLVVIAAIGATCPMSIEYAPRLAAMEKQLAPRGVAFVYLNAVDAETLGDMEGQVKRHRLEGPYLPDREHTVRRVLRVRTTTEAFVIDAARTLVYRGAVDDQYAIGDALPEPRHTYLADAIEAALAGDRPRVRATWSPGCLVDSGSEAAAAPAGPATYNGRIAWIMAESCVSCHRAGGAAPFPLDSYETVVGRAKMVRAVVQDGLMPPWHGAAASAASPGRFVNDRSLSKDDREALLAWLASDRPRGEEAPPPEFPPLSRTWTIGEADLILTTSGLRLPAQGGMQHARVMVGFNSPVDRWVTAFEFRPVEAGSVHHALFWILAPGQALPEPAEMPRGLELLGTYSPGDSVVRFPTGSARRIRAGSVLLVDLYATPMGKEAISALRIGMRWGTDDAAIRQRVRSVTSAAIALGPDASVEVAVPAGSALLSLRPYMRSRGRSIAVDWIPTSGAPERIIDGPKYDYRWLLRYEFAEPVAAASGRYVARGTFAAGDVPPPGSGGSDEALLLTAEFLEPVAQKPVQRNPIP